MNRKVIFWARLFALPLAGFTSFSQVQSAPDALPVKGQGTPGQIPLWLDNRTAGNSVITELNGRVGLRDGPSPGALRWSWHCWQRLEC